MTAPARWQHVARLAREDQSRACADEAERHLRLASAALAAWGDRLASMNGRRHRTTDDLAARMVTVADHLRNALGRAS